MNRTPISPMSAKRRERLAAEGTYQPGITFARRAQGEKPAAPPRCAKHRYPDELAARIALAEIAAKDKEGRGERKAYLCWCGRWHLTSKPGAGRRRASAARGSRPGSGLRAFPRPVQRALDIRDGICQRCGVAGPLHRHHRRGKGIGGDRRAHAQCPCNGVELCSWNPVDGMGGCHRWAHLHPRDAQAQGFIVSHEVECPGDVGVMRFAACEGGATQWPDCSGGWRETAPEAGEAA